MTPVPLLLLFQAQTSSSDSRGERGGHPKTSLKILLFWTTCAILSIFQFDCHKVKK